MYSYQNNHQSKREMYKPLDILPQITRNVSQDQNNTAFEN